MAHPTLIGSVIFAAQWRNFIALARITFARGAMMSGERLRTARFKFEIATE